MISDRTKLPVAYRLNLKYRFSGVSIDFFIMEPDVSELPVCGCSHIIILIKREHNNHILYSLIGH